jgi:transcription elongation factor Elf1
MNKKGNGKLEQNVAIALSIGVSICVAIIAFGSLSAKESAILSLLLTILSVMASWIFSTIHSSSQHAEAISEVKEMHNENLKTYALKAAEKVNNLSDQLNRLSLFLEDELQDDDEKIIDGKQRILSAIHMIAMLKSVNDTSLSDWQGVIGEEIEEHRKEVVEKEKELVNLMDKVEHLWGSYEQETITAEIVDKRVNQLKREMKTLAGNMAGTHISIPRVRKQTKRDLRYSCPSCEHDVNYIQRAKNGSAKPLVCDNCSVSLISIYDVKSDDFILNISGPKLEEFNCPSCKENTSGTVDTRPHQKSTISCGQCDQSITLTRLTTGKVGITLATQDSHDGTVINDEFILQVKLELPTQPWPKNVHKQVANKLSVSHASVQKAITALILQGEVKDQKDGVLYDIVEAK